MSEILKKSGKGNNEIIIGVAVIIGIIFIFVKTYLYFNQRINLITCNSHMATLADALDKYYHLSNAPIAGLLNPDHTINYDVLRQKKILLLEIHCPDNGQYLLDGGNLVSCTIHGQNRRE